MPPPTIAIIGAGPAGLTLAKLLTSSSYSNSLSTTTTNTTISSPSSPPQSPSLNISVYDLDPSPHSRTHQGGTLDLHPSTGLLALRKCGLWDVVEPWLRYEGEELVIADKNAWAFVHMKELPRKPRKDGMEADGESNGEEGGTRKGKGKKKVWDYEDQRPEIDREKLKELLLQGVGEDRVTWGKKLRRVLSADNSEGRRLEFEDGSVEGPFDLIVGADGAFSKVRHVLTDVRPEYAGICGVEGNIPNPKEEFPEVDAMVGRGSYFSYSNEKALMGQRMGDDSIKVGTWVKRDKEWVEDLWEEKGDDAEAVRRVLLEEYMEWTEEMRDWIRACDRSFRKWVLWELPVGHTWEHQKGCTLIGDAAHLCTPFAGLGVNAAMKDALDLSELIAKSAAGGIALDEAVEQYEKMMFPRAKEVQTRTMLNKESMFSQDSPVSFMKAMVGVMGEELGWSLDEGVLRWIPVRKMTYASMWLFAKVGAFRRWLRETFWRRKPIALH